MTKNEERLLVKKYIIEGVVVVMLALIVVAATYAEETGRGPEMGGNFENTTQSN